MLNVLNAPAANRDTAAALPRRQADSEEWTLATLIAILLRRLRMIAAIVAGCVALALLYLLFAEPHFTATSAIIPDVKRSPPAPNEVAQESLIDPAVVENQIEIIKSERVALAVIDKLGLQDDPEFVGKGPGLLARALSALLPSEPSSVSAAELKRRRAVAAFSRMLKTLRVGRSYLTEISFTSIDPVKAATIANEIAAAYIHDQLSAKFSNADHSGRWMRERIAELERESEAAAKAIEEFKAKSKLQTDAHGVPKALREQKELAALVERAKAETALKQARLERTQAALRAEDRTELPDTGFLDAIQDSDLTRLRNVYLQTLREAPPRPFEERGQAPDDPELAAKLAKQRNAVWDAVHALADTAAKDFESAQLREAAIVRRLAELAPQATEARKNLERLRELEARLASSRQMHESLKNRFARVNQFVQQQSFPVTEARIITEATPPLRKSSPKSLLILMLAVSAGCTVGVGAAFAAEYFDRGIKRPEQISETLGLRPLGALHRFDASTVRPAAGQERGGARANAATGGGLLAQQIGRWLAEPAGETLRGVRVAIDDVTRPAGARVVAVISPNPGEGKTTVALALAMLAARGGKRALLIDADLREPSLTRALTPGASGGLASAVQQFPMGSDRTVRHELGFGFLGQAPGFDAAHPSDILASDAMQDMLEQFRSRYDYIIVDTPAFLAHVDVAAAAGLFDAFVMIAEFGRTSLDDLDRAAGDANRIRERLVGVLINKAPRTRPRVRFSRSWKRPREA